MGTVVDLFCGCGGLSAGFIENGDQVVAAYDGWKHAVDCYNHNIEDNLARIFDLGDVRKAVKSINTYNPLTIIGGPPCQDYSNAGKRIEGNRANLTYSFADIICAIKPNYFVMENVPQIRFSANYKKATSLYRKTGYGITEIMLDASRCGVPQNRKRYFCIGALGDKDGFLLDTLFSRSTNSPISVREYFAANQYDLDVDIYYRHPTTYKRRAIFSVDETAPTIRGTNRPKPGTYTLHPLDNIGSHNLKDVRSLTTCERALIQTFPSSFDFRLDISKSTLDQIIGNAVPVKMAETVACCLSDYIEENQMVNKSGFASWLRTEKGYTDRSISDVYSRLKRAEKLLPNRPFDHYFITDLEDTGEFNDLDVDIKSQIRKAVKLRRAYAEAKPQTE